MELNNKTIADFMEFDMEIFEIDYLEEFSELSKTRMGTIQDLKYHISWDWLIPVFKKTIVIPTKQIIPRHMDLSTARNYHYISVNFFLDINKMYKAVLEFINWYNKTEQKCT